MFSLGEVWENLGTVRPYRRICYVNRGHLRFRRLLLQFRAFTDKREMTAVANVKSQSPAVDFTAFLASARVYFISAWPPVKLIVIAAREARQCGAIVATKVEVTPASSFLRRNYDRGITKSFSRRGDEKRLLRLWFINGHSDTSPLARLFKVAPARARARAARNITLLKKSIVQKFIGVRNVHTPSVKG